MEQAETYKNNNLKIKPVFARHETFHPRYGWLKKGYDKNEFLSQEKDRARVVMGVGQNMVNSIRYWCQAFKILDKENAYNPTKFGDNLLNNNAGWDPYLEDPSSLWLLHWNLFRPPCFATAWYFIFNEFNQISFSSNDVLFSLKEYLNRDFPTFKVTESSLTKDINCILRMYVGKTTERIMKEDSINCPFMDLGLITAYSDSKRFAFNFGHKATLAHEIIVSACLEFASRTKSSAKTMSLSRLLYDPGSPGQAFKLTESSLCEAIENVTKQYKEILISDTAGMIQFSYRNDPIELSLSLLNDYYEKRK